VVACGRGSLAPRERRGSIAEAGGGRETKDAENAKQPFFTGLSLLLLRPRLLSLARPHTTTRPHRYLLAHHLALSLSLSRRCQLVGVLAMR